MRKFAPLLQSLALLSILFITLTYQQCSFYNPNTEKDYDLSVLTIMPGAVDYIYMDNVRKLEFSVNICGQSSFTCNPPNGMCQKSTSFAGSPIYTGCGNGSPESVRFFPYMPDPEADGVTLLYEGGTYCSAVGLGRKTYINVLCDPDVDVTNITSVKEDADPNNACTYQVNMVTNLICTGGSSSGGGVSIGLIILIVVPILFILYFVIGMIIKYKKYEARGLEMIPNLDFWKSLPFLFKDGCAFFIQKVSRGKFCEDYQPGGN